MEHLEHRQKLSIMFAIMSAMFFSALNQTMIGTALPHIITDLGGLEYFSWVFTVFILASSIPAVIVGRLSDIYGRKPYILWGIAIFIIGSVLCGLAEDIFWLIAFRAIQGIGGGIVMATSFTAVGDLFSPRERGRWQGILGASFGIASVFGPTLGGYIVDHWHWQWVFWIFIPVGFVAFFMIVKLFPSVEKKPKQKIDYLGSVLLTSVVVPLLLAATWVGQRYAWSSIEIISLLSVSIISFIIFIAVERRAAHPILPLHLFSNRIFSLSNMIVFMIGASMFGSLMYVPMFLQGVMSMSATVSGTMMMPMTVSLVIASVLGGQTITRTGKYKNLAFFGLAVCAVGMYLLSTMDHDTAMPICLAYIVIVGLGLGIGMPIFNLTIQNAVDHGHLGVATATGQLFRQLGGTLGVALMGTVMTYTMHAELNAKLAAPTNAQIRQLSPDMLNQLENPQLLLNPGKLTELIHTMPIETQTAMQQVVVAMREALNVGLSLVFIGGALAMGLAVILVLWLREVPLRTSTHHRPEPETRTNLAE